MTTMIKGFFYESIGGQLHKCMFAGLDKDGKAQWLMVDQGAEVMTLSDYQEYALDNEELNLLCLMGDEVESSTMALLLGAVFNSYCPDVTKCMERLKKWHVTWQHDPVKMEVYPKEYLDERRHEKRFCYYIIGNPLGIVINEQDDFKTVDDLMDHVRQYFDALEKEAGIPVTSKRLMAEDELLEKISKEHLIMFDKN